jgi:hypothetical protein
MKVRFAIILVRCSSAYLGCWPSPPSACGIWVAKWRQCPKLLCAFPLHVPRLHLLFFFSFFIVHARIGIEVRRFQFSIIQLISNYFILYNLCHMPWPWVQYKFYRHTLIQLVQIKGSHVVDNHWTKLLDNWTSQIKIVKKTQCSASRQNFLIPGYHVCLTKWIYKFHFRLKGQIQQDYSKETKVEE